jgi:isoquinoline 1-oxidoreductase alpha subunit
MSTKRAIPATGPSARHHQCHPPYTHSLPNQAVLSADYKGLASSTIGAYWSRLVIFTLNINGDARRVDVDGDTPLLWVLRDTLDLVGTKFGCGGGFCGACTVHIDGQARRSCMTRVSQVGAARVTTIEGLSADGRHPVQRAWEEIDVAQCGYCQAGQIMTAAALLARTPAPSDEEIQTAMTGNICRCGTYMRIRRAVRRASEITASTSQIRER